ncbi:DUF397 domain-containing protein [Actinomadura spongiicola]|uniref:DUF397 domain-containing protein n=1 Tax=Actinomadura spongiicola TaxID=2303421 RepID=A0A372GNH9_9ACTN|nr:DUF397 domain-containing protein [Actinomadura spongiicola]RFS86885.1 DUF397 domain-containing protein [Actinomadura spongiicola]
MNVEWRKSSESGTTGGTSGDCVELALLDGVIGIRDSKKPDGPKLAFSVPDARAFLTWIKCGDLDKV